MKNIIRNIALATTLIGVLFSEGCRKEQNDRDNRLPEVGNNQTLILHPDYLRGTSNLGYTLLTDLDFDGTWDLAEKYHAGYTTGDGLHALFYKKGFGPARSVELETKFVEPEFFELGQP
jgi:hypothetical protein